MFVHIDYSLHLAIHKEHSEFAKFMTNSLLLAYAKIARGKEDDF